MSKPAALGGTTVERVRKRRSRPTPKWLRQTNGLDAVARRRCLLVLSVLSGETPVSDAIEEARISRGTYYQLETRALQAMLHALNPMAPTSGREESRARERIEALEAKLKRSEQERRRSQRLLRLVRLSIRAPVTTGRRGRLPKAPLAPERSTPRGESSP
jgi:hypothetical protein